MWIVPQIKAMIIRIKSIWERFIDKPFSYTNYHHDSDTVKGHRYNDTYSEEGHANG